MFKKVLILAVLASAVFMSGCTETCCDQKSNVSSAQASTTRLIDLKDAQIAHLKQQIVKLEAKVEVSKEQFEQSANMMMDAFKQTVTENKKLKAELKGLKK